MGLSEKRIFWNPLYLTVGSTTIASVGFYPLDFGNRGGELRIGVVCEQPDSDNGKWIVEVDDKVKVALLFGSCMNLFEKDVSGRVWFGGADRKAFWHEMEIMNAFDSVSVFANVGLEIFDPQWVTELLQDIHPPISRLYQETVTFRLEIG